MEGTAKKYEPVSANAFHCARELVRLDSHEAGGRRAEEGAGGPKGTGCIMQ